MNEKGKTYMKDRITNKKQVFGVLKGIPQKTA